MTQLFFVKIGIVWLKELYVLNGGLYLFWVLGEGFWVKGEGYWGVKLTRMLTLCGLGLRVGRYFVLGEFFELDKVGNRDS